MARTSADLCSGLPERRPEVAAADAPQPRARLHAVVKLILVGVTAFAIGLVAMVAMRSFGWATGLLAAVGGPVLIATVVERLYAG